MMVVEKILLECLNKILPEIETLRVENKKLERKQEREQESAVESMFEWYDVCCLKEKRVEQLEAQIKSLKAKIKEQKAATFNSSNSLKEAV